jgi:cytochrome P450
MTDDPPPALRTHPVVPANSRYAIRDTVLPLGGGVDGKSPLFVPKGTMVGYNTYVMHRRTDLYGPDANEYIPERWATLRPGWEYLPFNGGPRICLGQQYALTEASYVTVRLVQEFSAIESRDPGDWVEGLTLTLCSLNGTKVGLTPA